MKINFLTADRPLAKFFSPTEKRPYPLVSKFTSHHFTVKNIQEFYKHIVKFAEKGGCLLKGELTKPLVDESRAGSTQADTPSWYSCFDIDRCSLAINTPELFIKRCLPSAFHNVSYIWQVSNSAKISKHCLAGHLFFIHKNPINAKILKQIYLALNFANENLENEIQLSHNGQSLSFGLDVTTAQNDKLLFIAPPILQDLRDPFDERISFIKHDNDVVDLNPTDYSVINTNAKIKEKINQLRQIAGLPKRAGKTKSEHGITILTNPEKAIFRGPYIRERGFVYGNLNNGDSYAYFHPENNPKYLYNFKGEPVVRLQDIDPDYWNSIVSSTNTDVKHYAIRDRISDTYYTVIEYADTYEMYKVSNLQKAQDFLRLFNQEIPEALPIWDVVFQPNIDFMIDHDKRLINTYQKTEFLKNAIPTTYCPPKFFELVSHVTGNDPEMRDDLLNWLAYIIQHREKTQTAFVLQGRTGTGKGVLFNNIIRPILGHKHCAMIMMDDIDGSFNEWIENAILVVVDEAQINDDPKKAKKRINKIKNLITEPISQLKIKYINAIQKENYLNMLFTSNEYDSIHIAANDRRFKIAPRQESKLEYTKQDIEQLGFILQDIANYLVGYPVNETKVREVIHNEARANLIEASQSSLDEFIEIIKNGDLDKLLSYRGEFALSIHEAYKSRFEDLLNTWQHGIGTTQYVPTTDLRVAYNYLFNTDIGFVKFGKTLAAKSVSIVSKKHGNVPLRCVPIKWVSNTLTISQHGEVIPCGHSVN